ncbi:MAG: GNAT family N-acetyltransferase [Butyrivibrio sp.]|nr:GNAT family N-acetyltransferase [Butyrivibrio sp.]
MKLRPLNIKDANLMLEWMHDDNVVHYLDKDFSKLTKEDCISFIDSAVSEAQKNVSEQNYVHLGIVDDSDEYLGTVSLKDIDRQEKNAEFGISIRAKAMGCGIAGEAMGRIIKIGFEEYGLDKIFWYVNSENKRALRFYEKNGYSVIDETDPRISKNVKTAENREYVWFLIEKKDAEH